jgi:hypothetical protein
MLQNPTIMQLIGQNPRAPMIQAALTAHVAEHVGFMMRQQVEQQLGLPLPPEGEQLPPNVEIALSAMMAQASQQVLMQDQAKAAQQQAQQQQQDPVVQMQMQELQLKAKEVELKEKKILVDAAIAADKQELEEQKVSGNLELEALRVGAQINESKNKAQFEQERDGIKLGVDIAKSKAQQLQQAMAAASQSGKQEKKPK